jgi:cell division protein FtsQ
MVNKTTIDDSPFTIHNMASNRTIKRIILGTIWSIVAGGVVTLLVAANSKQQVQHCANVEIMVKGTGEQYFISKSDIAFLLSANGEPTLKGMSLDDIDLARLERRLEGQSWIQDAELYFDRVNVLHVTVTERQPIARVFAANGTSFYIDSSGAKLPLLRHITARLPVVTNYPSATRPLAKDSTAMAQTRQLVQFINGHPFWSAQLAQVDITPVGGFELLPTVGNHIIRIGNTDSLESKLDRLMLFYKQVLSKVGFDKYSAIDVQFAGQVVAEHKGAKSGIDSAALKRNIAELLRADQIMKAHEAAEKVADKNAPATDKVQKVPSTAADLVAPTSGKAPEEPKPVAKQVENEVKAKREEPKMVRKEVEKKAPTRKEEPKKSTAKKEPAKEQKPKAVMKPKT